MLFQHRLYQGCDRPGHSCGRHTSALPFLITRNPSAAATATGARTSCAARDGMASWGPCDKHTDGTTLRPMRGGAALLERPLACGAISAGRKVRRARVSSHCVRPWGKAWSSVDEV